MPPRTPRGRFAAYRDEPMTRFAWLAGAVIVLELAVFYALTVGIRPLGG